MSQAGETGEFHQLLSTRLWSLWEALSLLRLTKKAVQIADHDQKTAVTAPGGEE
jgi:hypothetical protein